MSINSSIFPGDSGSHPTFGMLLGVTCKNLVQRSQTVFSVNSRGLGGGVGWGGGFSLYTVWFGEKLPYSPPAGGGLYAKICPLKMASDYINMMPKDQGNVRYEGFCP